MMRTVKGSLANNIFFGTCAVLAITSLLQTVRQLLRHSQQPQLAYWQLQAQQRQDDSKNALNASNFSQPHQIVNSTQTPSCTLPTGTLPSDIAATMRQSERKGFDRSVQFAPMIDDKCIRGHLQSYLHHCEDKMRPLPSNIVEYGKRGDGSRCLCPCVQEHLNGRVNLFFNDSFYYPTSSVYQDIARRSDNRRWTGGRWTPINCMPRSRIAIIVPYCEREKHLKIFINHIVPFLERQLVDFQIFVIEQLEPELFGKSTLLNIGFLEALKLGDFDCFIFHDVDLFPLDDRNFYGCRTEAPIHMTAYLDKHKYRPIYESWFGGVTAFTHKQFEDVNGFGIKYYGWGGEDDDMYTRVKTKKYNRLRAEQCVGLYNSIRHQRDKRFPDGKFFFDGKRRVPQNHHGKGLRETTYTLLKTVDEILYIKYLVVIPPAPEP